MAFTHLPKVQQNFTCFAIVCVDFLKLPLKDILASKIRPNDLYKEIQSCSALTKGKKQLRPEQQNICFLPPPDIPDYNKFDVSLLYTLIRNLCPSLRPTQGWGNAPRETDKKIGDDIERLRLLRNNTYAHAESTCIPDTKFEDTWKKMKLVIQRIKTFTNASTDYDDELSRIKTGTFEHTTMESYKSQLQIDVDFFKDYELKDQPEISIEGIGRLSSGGTAQFKANIKNVVSSEWTNYWEKVKGMTTEKLILHDKKYTGSSNTVLIIWHVSKEDEGFYQASISQNNKTYISNSIELQVAEDLDNEKNSFHKDDGRNIEFAKFCQELNRDFPDDELDSLKDLIIDSTKMDSVEQAKTARECFRILKKKKLFTSNDVIIMQFLLQETHCGGLFEKCMKYAEANGAVHFKPATHPENGRTCVRFHVLTNLMDYSDRYCEELKKTVAAIVGCKHEEIEIVEFKRTMSFEVVLSIKDMNLQNLLAMPQIDHEQLYRLKVDYFIADGRKVFIKSAETDDPTISIKVEKEGKGGETARFVAEVTPIDLFGWSLSWQKIDKQISERIDTSQDKYRGSTERRLVIQSLQKEDEGDYQAILTRISCGKYHIRSNTASLQFFGDRPLCYNLGVTLGTEEIVLHLQDKSLKHLSKVRQIQWTKDGVELNLESDRYSFGSLDDIFLKIMSPTEKDIGRYTCTVTDDNGSIQQYVTLGLPSVNITTEMTVYFGCKTRIVSKISSFPSFERVEWQHSSDGEHFFPINIGIEKHIEINPKADYSVLTIPKTTLEDKKHYRLLVWNKMGITFSNTLFLNVIESPPNVETSTATDRMQRCVKLISEIFLYDKNELENVFWTKNGEKIDTFAETNNCKYSKVSIDNPSLTIYNVSHHDAGSYQFTALNAVGSTKSDIIRLEQPNIYTEKINRESNDATCMCFMATIESIPAVCHVQWSVKDKNDDTFRAIDLNSEEYKGTSISLPHPVLVVKGKRCLENHCYQIEVTNFVGVSTKSIKIDQEELNLDKENGMKYRKLCDDLVKRFPVEKLDQLKDVLLDISRVDLRCLELAKSTRECIELIHSSGYVTSRDVHFMETLLKVTNSSYLSSNLSSNLRSNLSLDEDTDNEDPWKRFFFHRHERDLQIPMYNWNSDHSNSFFALLELRTFLFKEILNSQINPRNLYNAINTSPNLTTSKQLRTCQVRICFVSPPEVPDYNKFDDQLLYTLIRNLCPSLRPTIGWGHEPGNINRTIGDDIERLKLLKENDLTHVSYLRLIPTEFEGLSENVWRKIRPIVRRVTDFLKQAVSYTKYEEELMNIGMRSFEDSNIANFFCILLMFEVNIKERRTIKPLKVSSTSNKIIIHYDYEVFLKQQQKIYIAWTKNDIPFKLDGNKYKGGKVGDSSLIITSPTINDGGSYTCFIANSSCKTPESDTVQVTLELPKITVDRKRKNDEMGTKMFVVSIESFLAVSYAQWSKKNNDDNSFTPVDVNAEDYKGTSNSLPCPVLVFKQKQKELTQCFQIAVTNSVGTSYKMIQVGNVPIFLTSITVSKLPIIFHITGLTSKSICVSGRGGLCQLSIDGNEQQKLNHHFFFGQHTVTETGELLFLEQNKVLKLTTAGVTSMLYLLEYDPISIYCSKTSGDILLGGSHKVTRYNTTGNKLWETGKDTLGNNIYEKPAYITEQKNGNIAVSDIVKKSVVAVDSLGQYCFEYGGHHSQLDFHPRGICSSQSGELLVCNSSTLNASVHLLNQRGKFIKLLLTNEEHGIRVPCALYLGENLSLFVAHSQNIINVYEMD